MRKLSRVHLLMFLGTFALGVAARAQSSNEEPFCEQYRVLCPDTFDNTNYEGKYVGHDEPALLFYSDKEGSGNSSIYLMTLPEDPSTLPNQSGTAGTFNFQLRIAFWFGMAMCDSESFPNFTKTCVPDTDDNIFDDPLFSSPKWIGHHPGAAYMEMQFYPPGWVNWPDHPSGCDPFNWCAAMAIFSYSHSLTQINNSACSDQPSNFAFITKTGVAQAPANPTNFSAAKFTPDPDKVLLIKSGDSLRVIMRDTPEGFQVTIIDLTTLQSGSMTASIANGFAQVNFEPSATVCHTNSYAFHSMYATSSEHTRVPWTIHSYNIAFSDEIGHFEYCSGITGFSSSSCPSTGGDPIGSRDADDVRCFGPSASSRVPVGGCWGNDLDFDGPAYKNNWPGTLGNFQLDRLLHPTPVRFTSPLFLHSVENGTDFKFGNYSRVAFETELPAFESATNPPCDFTTGANCVNPPVGASFYPIFTTAESEALEQCVWQQGGPHIPGTTNLLGGTSTAEYGSLLPLNYAFAFSPGFFVRFYDFRQILPRNPCKLKISKISRGEDRIHEKVGSDDADAEESRDP